MIWSLNSQIIWDKPIGELLKSQGGHWAEVTVPRSVADCLVVSSSFKTLDIEAFLRSIDVKFDRKANRLEEQPDGTLSGLTNWQTWYERELQIAATGRTVPGTPSLDEIKAAGLLDVSAAKRLVDSSCAAISLTALTKASRHFVSVFEPFVVLSRRFDSQHDTTDALGFLNSLAANAEVSTSLGVPLARDPVGLIKYSPLENGVVMEVRIMSQTDGVWHSWSDALSWKPLLSYDLLPDLKKRLESTEFQPASTQGLTDVGTIEEPVRPLLESLVASIRSAGFEDVSVILDQRWLPSLKSMSGQSGLKAGQVLQRLAGRAPVRVTMVGSHLTILPAFPKTSRDLSLSDDHFKEYARTCKSGQETEAAYLALIGSSKDTRVAPVINYVRATLKENGARMYEEVPSWTIASAIHRLAWLRGADEVSGGPTADSFDLRRALDAWTAVDVAKGLSTGAKTSWQPLLTSTVNFVSRVKAQTGESSVTLIRVAAESGSGFGHLTPYAFGQGLRTRLGTNATESQILGMSLQVVDQVQKRLIFWEGNKTLQVPTFSRFEGAPRTVILRDLPESVSSEVLKGYSGS